MLMTIILLIAGLSLSGYMMLHYAKLQNGPLTESALNDPGNSSELNLQAASSFFKNLVAPEQKGAKMPASAAIKTDDQSNVIDHLFNSRQDSVKWPKLKLTGFGTASDGSGGFAIINNHQYHKGQFITGKTRLLEVRKHDVLVGLNGATKTLTVHVTD